MGKTTVFDENKTKKRKSNFRKAEYRDCKFDIDGWADSKKYLPKDFDLVYMKTKDKTCHGWHCGNIWDGLKIQPEYNVLYWKKKE